MLCAKYNLALLGSLILLTSSPRMARAEWIDQRITPRSASVSDRAFQVTFKNAGENTACEIAVIPRDGKHGSIRYWSNGALYRNPRGRAVTELPRERGKPISMIEKRGGQTVTYHFELPRKQLAATRFEFWDSATDSPEVIGGGTVYWFNLRDFLAH